MTYDEILMNFAYHRCMLRRFGPKISLRKEISMS